MDAAAVAECIESICRTPQANEQLAALLAENSPIYHGLSTGEAERIRGFVLARFERIGLSQTAMPFVIEELQTGLNPYTVAGAAKAVRGAVEPSEDMLALLASAAQRIASNDDFVQHRTLDATPCETQTSAMAEIIHTLAAAGPRARPYWGSIVALAEAGQLSPAALAAMNDGLPAGATGIKGCCCGGPPAVVLPNKSALPSQVLTDLLVQDQSGADFAFSDFLGRRPTVITFFYTRCMNPQKCSLTISKLGALQRRVDRLGLTHSTNICAITYDPAYDSPDRLRLYGAERGFRFDERNRLIRTAGPFDPVQAAFDINVGFGPGTVNRHSVELLILDSKAAVAREFRRVLWTEHEIAESIRQMVDAEQEARPYLREGGIRRPTE
jgi:protein SCO1/2